MSFSSLNNSTFRRDERIKGRYFLVGCPRSGTTLLQSLIATQPQIESFPETHFFGLPGITRWHFWVLRFGYAPYAMRQRMQEQLKALLADRDQTDLQGLIPKGGFRIQAYANAFVMILDRLASIQGKSLWLEKTPSHLYFVDLIERTIPEARFIHLVRDGLDVVASLFEVTRQNPSMWQGEYDIDRSIARWHLDLQLTQRHLHKTNHFLVKYEQLVKEPESTLADVCDFMGVTLQRDLVDQHTAVAKELILKHETWKDTARQNIRSVHREKFDRIFSAEQQTYIRQRIRALEM